MPIRDLVKARLEFKKIPDEEKMVNEEIRDLFREIEEELRYRYVKYTSIYLQVLSIFSRRKVKSKGPKSFFRYICSSSLGHPIGF